MRTDWQALKHAFTQRFRPSDLLRWKKASNLCNGCQADGETVDVYITAIKKMAASVGVTGDMLRYAIQRGLRPQLLKHAIQQQLTTVDDLVQAARVAEAAEKAVAPSAEATALSFDRVVAELVASRHTSEANTEELRKFNSRLATKPVSAVSRSPSSSPQRSPAAPRRVTFAAEPRRGQGNQPIWRGRGRASTFQRQPRTSSVDQSTTATNCGYCRGNHVIGRQYCRASEVVCHNCRKMGHFARVCRGARRAVSSYAGPPNFSA